MDRVQVLKRETAAFGGDASDEAPWDAPIEPQEDAIEAAGIYLQDALNRDETTLVARAGDDMTFQDNNNPTAKILSEILTETGHQILRQLIHFIDEGPAEGFVSGAYKEILPSAALFPTSIIWWESSSKLKMIVERTLTWTGPNLTTSVWKMYDTDGFTVLATITDVISYSGIFETTRTRTIA